MKFKYFAWAAIGLAALSLLSCSKEIDMKSGVNVGERQQLTFNIAIPKGDPVTYATHDQAEFSIESLWMYEFNAADGKLLSAPVNIKAGLTGTGPDYSYTKTIATTDKGSRRFLFVANEEVSGMTANVSTLADLQAKIANKTLANNASSATILNDFGSNKRIPMTGEAMDGGSNIIPLTGTNQNIKVEMTRIVARIDITNNVPNLVISEVKLANTNSQSFLFLNGDYTKPTTNTKVSGISTFAAIPTSFAQGTTLAKAFYLYEGVQPTALGDALHIQVKGKLAGTDVLYSIPFYKENQPVTVKRNHIYKLVLKDATVSPSPGAGLSFTIEDTPWNEVTYNEAFAPLKMMFGSSDYSRLTIDPLSNKVTLDNNAYTGTQLIVLGVSPLTTHSSVTIETMETYSWLTLQTVASDPTRRNIAVKANTTGTVRTAVLKCYSNAAPEYVCYVTIVQNS